MMDVKRYGKWIVAILIFVTAVITSVFFFLGDKPEDYRNLQIYELDGSASVHREEVGLLDAYAGMALQSGDRIETGEKSYVYLKMDEDKFAVLEPETIIRLEASGNSADSRTTIHLEIGAIVNRLEEKLSENSSYEVTTPNSTMAVRGTIFRVEVKYDDEGVSHTNVSVEEGSVSCRLQYPDGTQDEEERILGEGESIGMWGNEKTSAYDEGASKTSEEDDEEQMPSDIDSFSSSDQTQQSSREDGDSLQESSIENQSDGKKPDKENSGEPKPPVTKPLDQQISNGEEDEGGGEDVEPPAEDDGQQGGGESGEDVEPPAEDDGQQGGGESGGDVEPPAEEDGQQGGGESGEDVEPPAGDDGQQGGGESGGDVEPPAGDEPTEEPEKPVVPATYTVTFMARGKVFAVQTIEENNFVSEPILMPTQKGYWDFDFNIVITENQTIHWVEETVEKEPPAEDDGQQGGSEDVEPPAGDDGQQGGGESGGDVEPPAGDEPTEEPEKPVVPVTYTVTFMTEGKVFAVQTIEENNFASEPILMPTQKGYWDFDFNMVITENQTIYWVEEAVEVEPSVPDTYTITFMARGKIFAVQTIEKDGFASKPILMPTQKGHWDFDFTVEITEDQIIYWVEETIEEEQPGASTSYAVVFSYKERIFASQSVEAGGIASKPILMPTPFGKWDFDFTKTIHQDTLVQWIEGVTE